MKRENASKKLQCNEKASLAPKRAYNPLGGLAALFLPKSAREELEGQKRLQELRDIASVLEDQLKQIGGQGRGMGQMIKSCKSALFLTSTFAPSAGA